MLPPSNSPSDASELRRRARLLSGIGRSTSANSPGPSCVFGAMEYWPRPSRVLSVATTLLDDRPARQRARVRAFRFGGRDEAIIVVGRHELHDRGLIAVGIDAGDMREVDLELRLEVEHARARGCGERPDGRALLVGPEQAAERRRETADGGIHERERLTREALQILECARARRRLPPANATCAIVGAIAVLIGLRDEPYARARVRARRRRLRLALRDLGSLLLRGQLLDHLASAARIPATPASRPMRPSPPA